MKTPFLIAPCSTPTPRRAFQGRAQKITCYQDEAFKALLERAMGGLHTRDVFQTKNEVCDPSGRSWRFKRGSG